MKAIFLDRDGVINRYPGDADYVKSWEEFIFLPGAKEALKKLKSRGWLLYIISNQAGVSKGLFSRPALDELTANMLKDLAASGAGIDGVYYCTHREQHNCSCRKPKTGLLEQAFSEAKKNGRAIEAGKSYFIGDTIRDVEAGRGAGLKTILVFSGKEQPQNKGSWKTLPDFTARDLAEAASIVIKSEEEN